MENIINNYYSTVNQYSYDNDKLNLIITKLEQSMLNQEQLLEKLTAMSGVVDKIKAESSASVQTIADLRALLQQQGNLSPEVEAKVAELEAKLKTVDDLVTDQAPAETPGGPTGGAMGDPTNP